MPVLSLGWKECWHWRVTNSELTRQGAVIRKREASAVTNNQSPGVSRKSGDRRKNLYLFVSLLIIISTSPHCDHMFLELLVFSFYNRVHFCLQIPKGCDELKEETEE